MRHAKGCSRSHPWLLGSFRVPSCRRRRQSRERREIKIAYANENHVGFRRPARGGSARTDLLRRCTSMAMEPLDCESRSASSTKTTTSRGGHDDVLARYDDNGNGKITCKEAPPARDRARPPVAPCVPVHARW